MRPCFYPNWGISRSTISGLLPSARMKNQIISSTFLIIEAAHGQVLTAEDSLNAGLVASDRTTVISGYGEVKVMAVR